MKKFGVLKLTINNQSNFMHYTSIDDVIFILSLKDTYFVSKIKEDSIDVVEMTLIPSNEKYHKKAEIIEDEEQVKEIFTVMKEEKNTYFKEYDDNLILIVLTDS